MPRISLPTLVSHPGVPVCDRDLKGNNCWAIRFRPQRLTPEGQKQGSKEIPR